MKKGLFTLIALVLTLSAVIALTFIVSADDTVENFEVRAYYGKIEASGTNPYFIAGIVSQEMIKSMNEKAIVCVLANPIPEIMPDLAKEAGAFIVATGRSDFENQINNSLAFPGIFKGVLQKGIKKITDDIKYNAALAIARYASIELKENKILPQALDRGIVDCIVSSL